MSIATVFAKVGAGLKKVGSFFKRLVVDVEQAEAMYEKVQSNGTKALMLQLFADVSALITEGAAVAAGEGVNFTADAAFVQGVQKLVADAKAGDATIVADLQLFGLDLPPAHASAASAPAATPAAPAGAQPNGMVVNAAGQLVPASA